MAVLHGLYSLKDKLQNPQLTKAQAQKGTHRLHGLGQQTNETLTKI